MFERSEDYEIKMAKNYLTPPTSLHGTHLTPDYSRVEDKFQLNPRRAGEKSSLTEFNRRGSFNSLGQGLGRIKYLDFYPEFYKNSKDIKVDMWTKTNDFNSLVDSANNWLSENPRFEPTTCESITWSSDDVRDLINPSDLMVTSICLEEATPTFFFLGLRLWYTTSSTKTPKSISVLEFIPMTTNSTIQELVLQIDSDIKLDEIINMETISLPLLSGYLESNMTSWKEHLDYGSVNAFFLRLYLISGREVIDKNNPCFYSHLSIMDFVPRLTSDGGFEGFGDLLERCNEWKNSTNIIIINLQSVFAKQDSVQHENTGNSCFFEKPGLNFGGSVDYFRILRVVHVNGMTQGLGTKDMEGRSPKGGPGGQFLPIIYDTFTPEIIKNPTMVGDEGVLSRKLGGQRVPLIEGMSQTFAKLAEFAADNDIEIVNLEMVSNPVQLRFDDNVQKNLLKFLFSIRLFYRHRNIRRESRLVESPKKLPRANEQGKPGPIFLKNVVSRRFPYRWLLLSFSAFASMTVIVVISIVYSNK